MRDLTPPDLGLALGLQPDSTKADSRTTCRLITRCAPRGQERVSIPRNVESYVRQGKHAYVPLRALPGQIVLVCLRLSPFAGGDRASPANPGSVRARRTSGRHVACLNQRCRPVLPTVLPRCTIRGADWPLGIARRIRMQLCMQFTVKGRLRMSQPVPTGIDECPACIYTWVNESQVRQVVVKALFGFRV